MKSQTKSILIPARQLSHARSLTHSVTIHDTPRYANNEINDPFAQTFIAEVTLVLKPYSSNLTPTNYDLFIQLLVASISYFFHSEG